MISVNLFNTGDKPSVTEMRGSNSELEIELAEAIFTYMYIDSQRRKNDSILDLAIGYHNAIDSGASYEEADAIVSEIADMVSTYMSDIASKILFLISDKDYVESRKQPDSVVSYCFNEELTDLLKDLAKDKTEE